VVYCFVSGLNAELGQEDELSANPPTYEELIELAIQGKPAPENWRESLDQSGLPLSQRLLIERGRLRSEETRPPPPLRTIRPGGLFGDIMGLEETPEEKASREREAQAQEQREQERSRRDRIYNAYLLDKSSGVDMSVYSLEMAVRETCREISENPSWFDSLRYD
jgi:hypothetical protein